MSLRRELLNLIEHMSDQQLALLLPQVLWLREHQAEAVSSEASEAYQSWIGAENDIYDEIFANELTTQ